MRSTEELLMTSVALTKKERIVYRAIQSVFLCAAIIQFVWPYVFGTRQDSVWEVALLWANGAVVAVFGIALKNNIRLIYHWKWLRR
jgi:hypothetical protein